MTNKQNKKIQYLSFAIVEKIHFNLVEFSRRTGEPLPPWKENLIKRDGLEGILSAIQTRYFGVEQYPTLESKSAHLFYSVAKGHVFFNGNKRMAVLITDVFLAMNGTVLSPDMVIMLGQKVIEVAESNPKEFKRITTDLCHWFKNSINKITL